MELAADSISVKVSEAIMHMQENSVSISTKARKSAQADDTEMKWTWMYFLLLSEYLLNLCVCIKAIICRFFKKKITKL